MLDFLLLKRQIKQVIVGVTYSTTSIYEKKVCERLTESDTSKKKMNSAIFSEGINIMDITKSIYANARTQNQIAWQPNMLIEPPYNYI